jgi:hypothetical protein
LITGKLMALTVVSAICSRLEGRTRAEFPRQFHFSRKIRKAKRIPGEKTDVTDGMRIGKLVGSLFLARLGGEIRIRQ